MDARSGWRGPAMVSARAIVSRRHWMRLSRGLVAQVVVLLASTSGARGPSSFWRSSQRAGERLLGRLPFLAVVVDPAARVVQGRPVQRGIADALDDGRGPLGPAFGVGQATGVAVGLRQLGGGLGAAGVVAPCLGHHHRPLQQRHRAVGGLAGRRARRVAGQLDAPQLDRRQLVHGPRLQRLIAQLPGRRRRVRGQAAGPGKVAQRAGGVHLRQRLVDARHLRAAGGIGGQRAASIRRSVTPHSATGGSDDDAAACSWVALAPGSDRSSAAKLARWPSRQSRRRSNSSPEMRWSVNAALQLSANMSRQAPAYSSKRPASVCQAAAAAPWSRGPAAGGAATFHSVIHHRGARPAAARRIGLDVAAHPERPHHRAGRQPRPPPAAAAGARDRPAAAPRSSPCPPGAPRDPPPGRPAPAAARAGAPVSWRRPAAPGRASTRPRRSAVGVAAAKRVLVVQQLVQRHARSRTRRWPGWPAAPSELLGRHVRGRAGGAGARCPRRCAPTARSR